MQRYYITDRLAAGWTTHQLLESIRRNVDAGVDFIQIREKDLCARALFDLVSQAVELASGSTTRVLVNDRTDIACAARANGVHLRSGSIAPERVRSIVDSDFLIAVSCHTLQDVDQAQSADLVVFGPVFASPGKGAPVGIEGLRAAASRSHVPVFALGGVNHDDALTCIAAGAAGFAGIRLFQPTALQSQTFREWSQEKSLPPDESPASSTPAPDHDAAKQRPQPQPSPRSS